MSPNCKYSEVVKGNFEGTQTNSLAPPDVGKDLSDLSDDISLVYPDRKKMSEAVTAFSSATKQGWDKQSGYKTPLEVLNNGASAAESCYTSEVSETETDGDDH